MVTKGPSLDLWGESGWDGGINGVNLVLPPPQTCQGRPDPTSAPQTQGPYSLHTSPYRPLFEPEEPPRATSSVPTAPSGTLHPPRPGPCNPLTYSTHSDSYRHL